MATMWQWNQQNDDAAVQFPMTARGRVSRLLRVATLLVVLHSVVAVSVPVTASGKPLLVFAKEAGAVCEVSVFDPADESIRNLTTKDRCPRRIFMSQRDRNIFYAHEGQIFRQPVNKSADPIVMATLPDLTFGPFARHALGRPLTDYEKMVAAGSLSVRGASFEDNQLWIHVGIVMAGDDDYDFLIHPVADNWVVEEFSHCKRFEICGFDAFSGKGTSAPLDVVAPPVWSDQVKDNPYYLRDDDRPGTIENDWFGQIDRYFEVAGKPALLKVWTRPSPDTGVTLTMGVSLQHSTDQHLAVCDRQCSAWIYNQYLLARRFWGGTLELFDITNGQSLLGPIHLAVWMNYPDP